MRTKYIFCILLFTGLMMGCSTTKIAVHPNDKLVGEWDIVAEETPQGDVPIVMTIAKSETGMFTGSFKSAMGNFAMSNLVLKDGMISCNFSVQGALFGFEGKFSGNEFKGETLGVGENYTTNGKKKEE